MTEFEQAVVKSIRTTTAEVFSAMLDSQIEFERCSIETGMPDAGGGVVSLIGVAGAWAGIGSLSCSPSMACKICSRMLMTETASVDNEVLDAVAELTNMIVGGLKTDLESRVGPLGLSIPTVVYGRRFSAKGSGSTEWIASSFRWEEEQLLVKVCLEQSHPAKHSGGGAPRIACSLGV